MPPTATATRDVFAEHPKGRQRRSRELLGEAVAATRLRPSSGCCATISTVARPGSGGSTPDEERHYTLCAHSEPLHWTTASIVAPLPSKLQTPWPIWISFGTPCTGIFLPVYLSGVIPAELARGGEEPRVIRCGGRSSGCRMRPARDPGRTTPMLRAGWAEFEDQLERARLVAEETARGGRAGRGSGPRRAGRHRVHGLGGHRGARARRVAPQPHLSDRAEALRSRLTRWGSEIARYAECAVSIASRVAPNARAGNIRRANPTGRRARSGCCAWWLAGTAGLFRSREWFLQKLRLVGEFILGPTQCLTCGANSVHGRGLRRFALTIES